MLWITVPWPVREAWQRLGCRKINILGTINMGNVRVLSKYVTILEHRSQESAQDNTFIYIHSPNTRPPLYQARIFTYCALCWSPQSFRALPWEAKFFMIMRTENHGNLVNLTNPRSSELSKSAPLWGVSSKSLSKCRVKSTSNSSRV